MSAPNRRGRSNASRQSTRAPLSRRNSSPIPRTRHCPKIRLPPIEWGNWTSTLRAKGTLVSKPRCSTPCEMRFFPCKKGKMAFVDGFSLKKPLSLSRLGNIASVCLWPSGYRKRPSVPNLKKREGVPEVGTKPLKALRGYWASNRGSRASNQGSQGSRRTPEALRG